MKKKKITALVVSFGFLFASCSSPRPIKEEPIKDCDELLNPLWVQKKIMADVVQRFPYYLKAAVPVGSLKLTKTGERFYPTTVTSGEGQEYVILYGFSPKRGKCAEFDSSYVILTPQKRFRNYPYKGN